MSNYTKYIEEYIESSSHLFLDPLVITPFGFFFTLIVSIISFLQFNKSNKCILIR